MRERVLPGEEFHHKNHKNVSKWSSRKERKCRGLAPRGNRPNRPRWDQDGWTDKTISFLLPRRFRLLCRWGGVGRRKWLQHCDKERNPMRVPDKWLMPLARGTFPRRNEGSS